MRIESGVRPLPESNPRAVQGKGTEEILSEKAATPETETSPAAAESKITPQSEPSVPEQRLSLQKKMEQQMEESSRALKQMREQMADMAKKAEEERERERIDKLCFEISERVFAGDKVPASDLSFLRKHDSGLYARAIMLRVKKRKPYEYQRLVRGKDLFDRPGTLTIKGGRNDKYMISGLGWRELSVGSFGAAFEEASGTVIRSSSVFEAAAGSTTDTTPGILLDTKG